MIRLMPRVRHQELGLLAGVALTVLALGGFVARDLRRSAEDASQLYDRLSKGIDAIDAIQFNTQEARRILLYTLHTSDANRQLEYAEQSRSADGRVQQRLNDRAELGSQPGVLQLVESVDRAWRRYIVVRDDVIGLILEGSPHEAVALDEVEGLVHFNEVRQAIGELKASFASDAEAQVLAAKTRADDATVRLTMLVFSALFGAAIGIYLVDRRAALEGVLRSEAHKGSILQAVPDPIISTDAAGRIVELNEAAERVFGFLRRDVLGASVEEILLPRGHRGELAAIMARTNESVRAATPRLETVAVRHDGSEFPVELTAVTHRAGSEGMWTIHVSDMTERHRSEQALRDAKDAAETAARVESDFLATMSHELRTPLNGVIGVADLLQNADLAPRHRDLVRMLRSSATALLGVVSDVLDYARIEQGLIDLAPAAFCVRDCIEDALDPVAELAARKGLEIGYLIDADVPLLVMADEGRVRQVLLNLLSNAVKFTDAGEVVVHVGAQPVPAGSVVITVSVQDSGPGIPAHLHHKLFQRFSQIGPASTRQRGGAGLGLAISARLSRLLGGSLSVSSCEGAGATFQFVFTARVVAEASTDVLANSLSGVNVLISVAPGIVGDQIHALLSHWDVCAVAALEDTPPPTTPADELHAFVVDGDAYDGSLLAIARRCRSPWALDKVPLVIVARPAATGNQTSEIHEYVVVKPVSARRLYEALHSAVRGARGGPDRPVDPLRLAPLPHASLAILLAEDNESHRRVLQFMLNELGLEADEVATGVDAIDRASARQYDVILMDVQMPGLDGLDTTRRIRTRQSGKRPLIFALTANVMPGEEARCLDAGMDGYLPKPLRFETLASIFQPLILRASS